MYEDIYLETDEEVTSVVEKIKKSKKKIILLTLPRNAVLGQSIVNLKLVYKQAMAEGKEVGVVSPDKVTRSLADRIGFQVFESAKEVAFDHPRALGPAPSRAERKDDKQSDEDDRAISSPPSPTIQPLAKEPPVAPTPAPLKAAGFTSQTVKVTPAKDEQEEDDSRSLTSADIPSEEPTRPSSSPLSAMIPTKGNVRYLYKRKRSIGWIPLIIVLAVIIIGLAGAAFAIPRSTVTVTAEAQPFHQTVDMVVDTDATAIDSEKAVIPGKIVVVNQETKSSAKATGKKDLGTTAKGTVTLYNSWDDKPRTFEAGTKIQASNGLQFALTNTTTLPGATSTISGGKSAIVAGQIAAAVEAVKPGDNGNLGASNFTILSSLLSKAQQDKIYATSTTAFTGGTSNVVTVVTQGDIDTLTEQVKATNKTDGLAELKKQAGSSSVLDKAVQTVSQDVTTSAQADAQADSVEVTVQGKHQAITFVPEDQKQLLEKVLATKIPDGQSLVTSGDGVGLDTSQSTLNLVSDKQLQFTTDLKAFTVPRFEESLIRRQLTAAMPKDVTTIVSKSVTATKTDIHTTPSWWPRMPLLASKITLTFTYVAKEK